VSEKPEFVVGTSGYSFADWVGTFYPPGTQRGEMFALYARHFSAAELNFTYYRMPSAETLGRIGARAPEGFLFWVKANRQTTHEGSRSAAGEFVENLHPLRASGMLAGVLLQFPQSFHRTVEARRYLAATIGDFAGVPLAVEFRHRSWEHPSVAAGLREREVALVVPDAPDLPGLFRPPATATTRTGYLRLHSRNAEKWYAGGAERYDYDYSEQELKAVAGDWTDLADQVDRVYAFFNNCHRGQAAANAEAFRRIVKGK